MPTWWWGLLPVAFVPGFVLFWCFVVWVISRVGWHPLTPLYRATAGRPSEGHFENAGHGRVGLANYKGCLIVGATPGGLYLDVWPFFRVGHPPLLIPWAAIRRVESTRVLWMEGLALTVGRAEGQGDVQVTLYHKSLFPALRVALGERAGPPPLP